MNIIFDLTTEDLPAFKDFVRTQFHERHILLHDDFLNWQYKNTPCNSFPEFSIKIVKHKNNVLGYCGVVPVVLKLGNTEIVAGVFANLLVDEKLRGFGFGTLLVREILKQFPVCYINGYSDKLKKVCQKFPGWVEMGDLHRYIGVLHQKKIETLAEDTYTFTPIKKPSKKDAQLHRVSAFGDDIDHFWSEVKERYPITIVRDQTYLNWRYTNHPFIEYQLYEYRNATGMSAYFVVRIEEFLYKKKKYKAARIIDFMSLPETEIVALQALTFAVSQAKIDFIDYFFSGQEHRESLIQLGFKNSKEKGYRNIPLLLNPVDKTRKAINWVAYTKDPLLSDNILPNPDNWYITKGDGDQDRPNFN